MEIVGKITKICERRDGQSAAGDWCKQDIIVKPFGGIDDQVIAVTFFGERKIEKLKGLKEGDVVQVFATVKSRTPDGEKYYTTVDASSATLMQRQTQAEIPPLQEQ